MEWCASRGGVEYALDYLWCAVILVPSLAGESICSACRGDAGFASEQLIFPQTASFCACGGFGGFAREDEDHSIFACSGILGYECFGSAALKSSKFGRESFHCGKCKDRVPSGWILFSPPGRPKVARWVYGDDAFCGPYRGPGYYGSPSWRSCWW